MLMKGKQKCNKILLENYRQKEYLTLKTPSAIRKYFATSPSMLPLAGNFSHGSRFRWTNWMCRCGSREEQEHIRSHCAIYKDIREKYNDLDSDDNLVNFFMEVLKRRDTLDEQEKEEKKSGRRKEREE